MFVSVASPTLPHGSIHSFIRLFVCVYLWEAGFERVTAPRGCVAPGAEAKRVIFWRVCIHFCPIWHSVVVGFVPFRSLMSCAVKWHLPLGFVPSCEEGNSVCVLVCALLLVSGGWRPACARMFVCITFLSRPEIKQGYPLNLSI